MSTPDKGMALANRKRPLTLDAVQGHDILCKTLSLVIANNLWAQHSPLFLQGSPGSGKTTLALLGARVTLCPNRPLNSPANCGACNTCTGRDTTNIVQYTCTGADADAIANLIDIGRGQPLPKENSPRLRFFILDEVSNMSNQQLSKFLEVLESSNPFNVWVMISMKPERMDTTLSNALLSRCSTFTLPPLTTEQVTDTLVHGGVSREVASAISPYCNGNARLAWRKFDSLLLLNPDATAEWIEGNLTGGATITNRNLMWRKLQEGDVQSVITLINGWACDSDTLISLLKGDVVEAMCTNPAPIQAKVLRGLISSKDTDTLYLLLSFVGKDVLNRSTPRTTNDIPLDPITAGALDNVVAGSAWSLLRDRYALHIH